MKCLLYSMKNGRVDIDDVYQVKIGGSEISEIMILDNHRPIIGEITGNFTIYGNEIEEYTVRKGFFDFNNNVLIIVGRYEK